MLEIDLQRQEVEESIAELDRLLARAEEAYELLAWAEENDDDD